jgi:hypothetical protein
MLKQGVYQLPLSCLCIQQKVVRGHLNVSSFGLFFVTVEVKSCAIAKSDFARPRESVLCQFMEDGVVCPAILQKGLFTTSAVANIDHNPSATTSCHYANHDTVSTSNTSLVKLTN